MSADLKQLLFGRYQAQEDRRFGDNQTLKMKMAYKAADIPEDDTGMKITDSRVITNKSGLSPWAAAALVGAAVVAQPLASRLLTPPAIVPPIVIPMSSSHSTAVPLPSVPPAAKTDAAADAEEAARKMISEEYDIIFRDENGTIKNVPRINDFGEVIPYSPIKVREGEE